MLGAALTVVHVAAAGMEETTGDGGPAKVTLHRISQENGHASPLQLN